MSPARPRPSASSRGSTASTPCGRKENAETVAKEFGRIDPLVNSAGGNLKTSMTGGAVRVFDLALDPILETIRLNFIGGTVAPCLAYGRRMVDSEHGGSLINISSINTFRPLEGRPAYVAATRHLIGEEVLRLVKNDCIIVNTSRGALIAKVALAAAQEGRIGGAALDVFDKEPPDFNDAIFSCETIVTTPHVAAMTANAQIAMAVGAGTEIRRVLVEGLPPTNNVLA
jgi:hypothetical protein